MKECITGFSTSNDVAREFLKSSTAIVWMKKQGLNNDWTIGTKRMSYNERKKVALFLNRNKCVKLKQRIKAVEGGFVIK